MESIKFKVDKEISLKKFLLEKSISKRSYKKLINNGLLTIDGNKTERNINLNKGNLVKISIEDENLDYKTIYKKLDILYEDKDIIAVNKEANLTVNSKNQESLSNYIAYYFKENNIRSKIRLINRLDMNTSGIMLIAKNKYAQAFYQGEIEKNNVNKFYISLVDGKLNIDRELKLNINYNSNLKKMELYPEGKEIRTYFKSMKIYNNFSLVESKLLTGKTHQIRLSLSSIGHPILGDKLYGSKYKLDRFLLHSYKLEFSCFRDNKKITILSRPQFDKYLNLGI
ncbi:RluA family pseudouridine synthase [Anaerococcus sp. AGMB00486]|uniref:RNA pseudouridylate synthase n=2 Tax=Anaerococcus TaxID=165779 RepID=A0ABX2N7K9_9FIRM|nr:MULTISPECIES: RluA family pseudouridine synthase [Anaerococcus]MSS76844.1 RluA family pseudouridine synthase [Anaerococcus porci]NVF10672.1 RluA family pseudouridine synthase [Anaerococcus faecalis]